MRVLFVMRHPGYVRNFAPVLDELASRGHDVHVGFEAPTARWLDGDPLEPLYERHARLSSGALPAVGRTRRSLLARGLRSSRDYLRYLDDAYRDAPRLRERAGRRVPRAVKSFPGVRFHSVRRVLAGALSSVERRVPANAAVVRYLGEQRPDLVLVTPLLALGSPQVEYVRAAKRRDLPTALAVASWDNLTNKGVLHELPDAVIVWNDAQREEAVRLLGVPVDLAVGPRLDRADGPEDAVAPRREHADPEQTGEDGAEPVRGDSDGRPMLQSHGAIVSSRRGAFLP